MGDLFFRNAASADEQVYLEWANDKDVRKYSFDQNIITPENHHRWFQKKIEKQNVLMLIFYNAEKHLLGQVRIEGEDEVVIGVSVAREHRGKGLSANIISKASIEYLRIFPKRSIFAYIKSNNISSLKCFEQAGYKIYEENKSEGFFKYIFTTENQKNERF